MEAGCGLPVETLLPSKGCSCISPYVSDARGFMTPRAFLSHRHQSGRRTVHEQHEPAVFACSTVPYKEIATWLRAP
jgi:hypothetical protein